MKIRSVLLATATLLTVVAGPAYATNIVWDFTTVPSSPPLGQSHNFVGSDGRTLLNLQAFGPNQPQLAGGKFDSGIGLTNSIFPDNEINPGSYIQVAIGGLFSSNLLSFQMGSIELTETWGLYGSNTQGNNNGLPADATYLRGCQTTATLNCEQQFNINSGGFKYLDVTMLPFADALHTNTGLLAEINGSPFPSPGPIAGAGLPGLLFGGGGLLAWWRRKRTAAVLSQPELPTKSRNPEDRPLKRSFFFHPRPDRSDTSAVLKHCVRARVRRHRQKILRLHPSKTGPEPPCPHA
jgi:hypothetical protein